MQKQSTLPIAQTILSFSAYSYLQKNQYRESIRKSLWKRKYTLEKQSISRLCRPALMRRDTNENSSRNYWKVGSISAVQKYLAVEGSYKSCLVSDVRTQGFHEVFRFWSRSFTTDKRQVPCHDIVDIVFNNAMAQLMTAVPGIPDNHCFCGIMPLVNS